MTSQPDTQAERKAIEEIIRAQVHEERLGGDANPAQAAAEILAMLTAAPAPPSPPPPGEPETTGYAVPVDEPRPPRLTGEWKWPLPGDTAKDRKNVVRIVETAIGTVAGAILDHPTMDHVRMGVIADRARDTAVTALLALLARPTPAPDPIAFALAAPPIYGAEEEADWKVTPEALREAYLAGAEMGSVNAEQHANIYVANALDTPARPEPGVVDDAADAVLRLNAERDKECEGCPPVGYPTDETRCLACPRRAALAAAPTVGVKP